MQINSTSGWMALICLAEGVVQAGGSAADTLRSEKANTMHAAARHFLKDMLAPPGKL